jgi:cellulose synthase operon protein C
VGELVRSLGPIDEILRTEIASLAVLLKAQAEFQLGREADALETGKRLRAQYGSSEAAIQSFLVEAEHFDRQEKIDEARLRLTTLVDSETYRHSPHIPYALFHLALLSERLGQPKNLEEANKRIEDLITLAADEGDLIFAARLKQGDLLRKLNQFPQAQRAYEYLVNRYPQRRDIVLAQLALAECHNAQSAADPTQTHANIARLKFEELRDRFDAPPDVRVEAGYNLGALLARRGKPDEAAKVWWLDVITPFLLEETRALPPDAKRRYWLARTLLELGALHEQQGKFEEAKTAYELVLRKQIGHGHAMARNALERLGVPTPGL